ncbi:protein cycle-like isoform X3 [Ctenocephalides felis]|nr:protein cycle-like isoform X3 [Ctenocephalides felis]
MLPLVVQSPRKVDKTGVLRHAAHYIRTEHVFGNSGSKARQTMSTAAVRAFVEAESGILFTVTCRGLIVAAENVEQMLGHCKNDLLGQSLLTITHPDDRDFLRQQLQPPNLPQLPGYRPQQQIKHLPGEIDEVKNHARNQIGTQEENDEDSLDKRLMEEKRSFHIRLARAGSRSEATTYEMMNIMGSFRRADKAPRPSCWQSQMVSKHKQQSRQRDTAEDACSYANDLVFIGMARPTIRPPAGDRILESLKPEYRTRHLIDGRIVQCDQRISVVAGYLTKEVAGLSPFTFMHKEDVRWVMIALRQMYDLSKPMGESCYRLVTRSGEFIYLKTTGFLEIDSKTHAVQSFVCINTLLDEKEGRALVREMKEKYSVKMMLPAPPEPPTTTPELEDPHQLEEAIMHLVSPLPGESRRTPSPTVAQSGSGADVPHSSRASLLEIKPPDLGSIKSSIHKSVEVISSVHLASPKPSPEADSPRPSVLRNVVPEESPRSNGNIKQELLSPAPYSLPEDYADPPFPLDELGNILPDSDVTRTLKKQNGVKRTNNDQVASAVNKRRIISGNDSQSKDIDLSLDCFQYDDSVVLCDDMECLDEGIICSDDGQKFQNNDLF